MRPETIRCLKERPRSPAAGTRLQGFTLIELLVVIAILGILASLLLPGLAQGRQAARSIQCLGHLKQMLIAVHAYTTSNDERFPPAYGIDESGGVRRSFGWDFTLIHEDPPRVVPGSLWAGDAAAPVQQCPSLPVPKRNPGDSTDPHTGYNYNTSYLGHGQFEAIPEPARVSEVRRPDQTAVFGDGGFSGGPNKFMRAPLPNPGDQGFRGRWAGTQGFRHRNRSNTGFCDGHATASRQAYRNTPDNPDRIVAGTGFLSPDNSLYDLD